MIALVITIIVLLILAGVSIATLTGENGILTQAETAREETERESVIEQAKLDILGEQIDSNGGGISAGTLQTILKKYFTEESVPADANTITAETVLTAKEEYGSHEITLSEIYNGEIIAEKEPLPITESYVGYYADIDGDKEPDGIIYVDLADSEHTSGRWNDDAVGWSDYEYTPVTEGLKKYEICKESYSGFEEKWEMPVITEIEGTTGADRFYVMALEDFNDGNGPYYCWYDDANGKLDNPLDDYTVNDFGDGRKNTIDMIAKWNSGYYGSKDQGENKDMWGAIQTAVGDINDPTWFVPSKSEWAAFGDMAFSKMGVTTYTYSDYGLSDWYWSSSQDNAYSAYIAGLDDGYISNRSVIHDGYVRLSATF